jgi:hypothetical protein
MEWIIYRFLIELIEKERVILHQYPVSFILKTSHSIPSTMKQAIIVAMFLTVFRIGHAYANPAQPETSYNDTSSAGIQATTQLLTEIMNVVGLRANFELKEAKVLNIEASVSHRKRYILYNPAYMTWITTVTKNKWAAMALLAHEVGHHLNGHTIRRGGSNPELELEADEFAGFVLRKSGASLEEAQEVMKYIAKTETSKTHPGRASRMSAIENGWNKAVVAEGLATAKRSPTLTGANN